MHRVNAPFTKAIVSSKPDGTRKRSIDLPSTTRILARLLLLALALGATAGCATSFLYERADRLANRWVNGYVELEPAQQARLETGLTELHEWHRREHLPAYAGWLRGIALRLGGAQPVSADELGVLGEELGEFWRELADRALPVLVEVGAALDDGQVAELTSSLREEREKELREAERRSEAWHRQRRVRSMERFLKRWTGLLNTGQREAIRAWSEQLEPSRELYFANRLGWLEDLEMALAQRDHEEALRLTARGLFVTPSQRWEPDYEALVQRNAERTTRFMVDFLANLEPQQRERAVARLERLAAEFESLSRAGD